MTAWYYGWLLFSDTSVPHEFVFAIEFQNGEVVQISSPFDGPLSTDGKPTTPSPFAPAFRAKIGYFPRIVDFRWTPSSGQYPMEYQIEIDHQLDPSRYISMCRKTLSTVHLAYSYGSMGTGRWRVRAKNKIGESDWTDYRYFECEK